MGSSSLTSHQLQIVLRIILVYQLCNAVMSQCRILRCNSQFVSATSHLDGSLNEDFCIALRSYSWCTQRTAWFCRGDLIYHSAVQGIEDLMIQHNCSKDGKVSLPRPHVPADNQDNLHLPDTCKYEMSFYYKQRQKPTYLYCGIFGNLHIRTFYNDFQTCRVQGAWPVIDNNYLTLQLTNAPIAPHHNISAISKVTAIFKNSKECIDQKVYQAEMDNVPAAFVDGSVNGGLRNGANSLVIKKMLSTGHVEIQASYIGTTLIVRQVGQHLSIAILMPEEVASSHTEDQDLQLCLTGCPFIERLPWTTHLHNAQKAKAKCKEGLLVEDNYFEYCVFDILVTGNPNISLATFKAVEDAKMLYPNKDLLHVFRNSWPGRPIPSCLPLLVSVLWVLFCNNIFSSKS
ncbi:repulsive guidance molecule A-like isoform X2 [Amblyraja radiata]|uniref:repulsive guidance molecule A-like isoform X2 n=1 Tax=Amblyraja radiata TaxID=386614 RepID=UPI001403BB9F|nr:repulsive guidance molecule A-like isoform X2 [Amblyraja radiata]